MTFSRVRRPHDTTPADPFVESSGEDGAARLRRLRSVPGTAPGPAAAGGAAAAPVPGTEPADGLPSMTLDPDLRPEERGIPGPEPAWWNVSAGVATEPSTGGRGSGEEERGPIRSTSRRGLGDGGPRPSTDDPARTRGALDAVAAAYTAANGHPTSHAGFEHVPDGGPRRWSVAARTAVVAALAVLLLAVGVGGWTLRGDGDLRPVATLADPATASEGGGAGPGGQASSETGARGDGSSTAPGATEASDVGATGGAGVSEVVVHVVGAVGAPGLVTVPEGSRVADALAAAGDATAEADLAGVNLAREVVDGEQIVVPRPGEVVVAAPGPETAPGSEAGPVDLNSADQTALDALSGIGPVLAARIVEWREANGRFTSVEELGEVSGIGDALLARLRDQVRV
ncbi:ComEA family DNA-binding protein [Oerskovia enterophila]|uniref:ComEA family DNA-binding protein n=1 Tax=Oerskovia enterophila TaxID=43678 RepID=UPI003392EF14